ncbi:MAG: GGDEF domain-containing protein [Porticoccus sp.]
MSQIMVRLLPPVFCLMLAGFINWHAQSLGSDQLSVLSQLPYILCGLAAFVAILANHSRDLGAALVMLTCYWLIRQYLQAPLDTEPAGQAYSLISLCLPILLGVLIILPNTGWRHLGFLVLISFISIFALIITSLFQWQPLWFSTLFPEFQQGAFLDLKISSAASMLFITAFIISLVLPLLKNEQLDSSLPGCILFSFITLAWFQTAHISATTFSAFGLLLIINQTHSLLNMVYRDELTQIPNRRALMRDVRNAGNTYALAMADVDHFKKINDQYGHDLGDQVLKAIATKLSQITGGGRAYRFGGEEFCLLFKGKTADNVIDNLETLRKIIAEYDMTARDKKSRPWRQNMGEKQRGASRSKGNIRATVSMGLSDSQDNLDFNSVLKAADKALYRAKEGGRNQIRQ